MRINTLFQLLSLAFLMTLTTVARAEYASINGIQMFYEVHGEGTPLVLLHGGYVDSDMWTIETHILAKTYQVIEIDSRGHGRSTDGSTPITYEQMAQDTLDLLNQLNIDNAHFAGWSDGAVIAAQIAAYQPQRVNKLILIGAAFGGDTYIPAFSTVLGSEVLFKTFADSTFGLKYRTVNPEPAHWPVFRDKLYTLWNTECYLPTDPEFCLEPLQRINAETLVMVGQNEIIRFDHTQAIVNAIAGAELDIVPLAGHFLPKTRPFTTGFKIREFLD
ncbi:alpha/beta hydrolase [Litoribacillus peritrichatus]|uniref:Alpha/beta fold hydrolase n=1 Tax=Litoribacillus peritrichatus TaxID=718191 RepID=A0ABP7N4B1_9GAMM